MSRNFVRVLLIVLGLVLAAQPADAQARRRGDRNLLTRVELDEAGTSIVTARDAVRVLRPQWLAPPLGRQATANMDGPGSGASEVVVYVDGLRQNELAALMTVPAAKVVEMRYLDQNRAIQMHGPGHEMGVIEVTTVDKRK